MKNQKDTQVIQKSVFARVGLLGNPSDGFGGKTLAMIVKNFFCTVTLAANPEITCSQIEIIPNADMDNTTFSSSDNLSSKLTSLGYNGAHNLMLATANKFFTTAQTQGWKLKDRGFKASYETNIPRQVGLSGSSALITAFFKCLLEFYEIDDERMPKILQPSFLLSVETEELGINAGLMDRVIQTYEGLVFMDFSTMKRDNLSYGVYESLNPSILQHPNALFFLAFKNFDQDSGRMHSDVKARFLKGEEEVVNAMKTFASFAQAGRDLLSSSSAFDTSAFGELMTQNFNLRRKIYGDAALGAENIEMVEIGRRFGAHVKFSGSGGAVVGLLSDKSLLSVIEKGYKTKGYNFELLKF